MPTTQPKTIGQLAPGYLSAIQEIGALSTLPCSNLQVIDSFQETGNERLWKDLPIRLTVAFKDDCHITLNMRMTDLGPAALTLIPELGADSYTGKFMYYNEVAIRFTAEAFARRDKDVLDRVKLIPIFGMSDTTLNFELHIGNQYICGLSTKQAHVHTVSRAYARGIGKNDSGEIKEETLSKYPVVKAFYEVANGLPKANAVKKAA